jgi:hypothetical protein
LLRSNRETGTGNWTADHACCAVAKKWVELFPFHLWYAELKSREPGYLGEEISKQKNTDAAAWLLLMTHSEM